MKSNAGSLTACRAMAACSWPMHSACVTGATRRTTPRTTRSKIPAMANIELETYWNSVRILYVIEGLKDYISIKTAITTRNIGIFRAFYVSNFRYFIIKLTCKTALNSFFFLSLEIRKIRNVIFRSNLDRHVQISRRHFEFSNIFDLR